MPPLDNLQKSLLALAVGNAFSNGALSAEINVSDLCTLEDAIVSANTDAISGGCTASDVVGVFGADTINLPAMSSIEVTNPADANENAFSMVSSDVTIQGNGSTISRDIASEAMRFFYVKGANAHLTLNDITLENGLTSSVGGAVRAGANSSLTINNSTLRGSTASASGGAISASARKLTLNNVNLFDNQVTALFAKGGGLFASLTPSTITGGEFIGNYASFGGAIYAGSMTLALSDVTVSNNSAGSRGGGLFAKSVGLTILNSDFDSNSSVKGGGIYAYSPLMMTGGTINNNSALDEGGGLFAANGRNNGITLNGTQVSGNEAEGQGGGVFIQHKSSLLPSQGIPTAEFVNAVISENTAKGRMVNGITTHGEGGGI